MFLLCCVCVLVDNKAKGAVYDGNDEQDTGDEHGGDGLRRRPGRKRTRKGR